jgi:nucleoid-associated protein YgaU
MKGKIFLILFSITLLGIFSLNGVAQETGKLTEGEAQELIEAYQQRVDAAEAKITEEQGKIDELRMQIRDLDQKLAACREELGKVGDMDTYTVVKGDFLAKLAEYDDIYGHGNYARWIEIYRANRDVIGDNPNLIYPGQIFMIPRP